MQGVSRNARLTQITRKARTCIRQSAHLVGQHFRTRRNDVDISLLSVKFAAFASPSQRRDALMIRGRLIFRAGLRANPLRAKTADHIADKIAAIKEPRNV